MVPAPAATLRLANESPLKEVLVPFTVAFPLGPGLSEPAHKPFKRRFSIPYGSVVLLEVSPIGFPSQMLWGLLFPL